MQSGNNSAGPGGPGGSPEDPGNIYFDVPGGISSQFQVNNQLNPYSYAPVHTSYGVGSLTGGGNDRVATDYETLRGVGDSTPYNYDQYLSWGLGGYATEIVTGYDSFGNPIIVRPGSSVPMEGYDNVEGYNWDLLPEHGPSFTDSPLVSPQRDAPSQEFYDSGVANVDRGIPGVLLGSQSAGFQPDYGYAMTSDGPRMPSNRDQYTSANGYIPALIGGGEWLWNPELTRMGYATNSEKGARGGERGDRENLGGNWSYVGRNGQWVKSTELSDEQIATRPTLDDARERGYVSRTTGHGGLGRPVQGYIPPGRDTYIDYGFKIY